MKFFKKKLYCCLPAVINKIQKIQNGCLFLVLTCHIWLIIYKMQHLIQVLKLTGMSYSSPFNFLYGNQVSLNTCSTMKWNRVLLCILSYQLNVSMFNVFYISGKSPRPISEYLSHVQGLWHITVWLEYKKVLCICHCASVYRKRTIRTPGGVLPIPGILRVCHLRGWVRENFSSALNRTF